MPFRLQARAHRTCTCLEQGPKNHWRRRGAVHVAAQAQEASRPKRLAVFVSGGGSNFKQIHSGCIGGQIKGEVAVCIAH